MNIEQVRTDFEVYARNNNYDLDAVVLLSKPPKFSRYVNQATQGAWEAYQAGRAALQSQDREGYAGVTVWVDRLQCTKIITRIQYEGSNADELLRHFEAAREAIDHALRVEEEGE